MSHEQSEPAIEDLRIIHYPHPVLRAKAEPVTEFGEALAQLVSRMFELMRAARGVGLAAPQVAVSKRLFVMNPTGEAEDDRVVINPQLIDPEGKIEAEEGCLSLPGVTVQMKRNARLKLVGQDLQGAQFELELEDLPARIAQHEHDHLDGVLIIDRMGPTDQIANKQAILALEEARGNGS